VCAVSVGAAVGAQPAPKTDKSDKSGITFPSFVIPPAPAPQPNPAPAGVPKLTHPRIVVVTSTTELFVRPHPAGVVTVKPEAGPITIRAPFADSALDFETRKFADPFVYIIEASGEGRVEIDFIPKGVTQVGDIKTLTLDVKSGKGPLPPPGPDPDPEVKPEPVKSFRVVLILESGDTPPREQANIVNAKIVRDYLNAKCTKEDGRAGWRQYDPQQVVTNEQPVMKALWESVKPTLGTGDVPCVAIEVNSKVKIVALPKSAKDLVDLLEQYYSGAKR
jgi:hypothetical protein